MLEFTDISYLLFQIIGACFQFAITLALFSWPLFLLANLFNKVWK